MCIIIVKVYGNDFVNRRNDKRTEEIINQWRESLKFENVQIRHNEIYIINNDERVSYEILRKVLNILNKPELKLRVQKL